MRGLGWDSRVDSASGLGRVPGGVEGWSGRLRRS